MVLEIRKTEMSSQLNAEKLVLCRQTASGRYMLTAGFTVQTYIMYSSYFSTPGPWHCHFKQRANIIQAQSVWLCSSIIPFPMVCLNHSLYFGNCRDWTQFPEGPSPWLRWLFFPVHSYHTHLPAEEAVPSCLGWMAPPDQLSCYGKTS